METPAIFTSMIKALESIGLIGISKDQKNQAQGFKFRGIDQVYNALNPILAEHKIFTTSEILDEWSDEHTNHKGTVLFYRRIKMKYTFWSGIDGSSVSTEVIGEGMDSGDKGTNKAMAIAHKYALLQAFCVPTEETDDPDKDSHTVIKSGQKQEAKQNPLIEQVKTLAKENYATGKNKFYDKPLINALGKMAKKENPLTTDELHWLVINLQTYKETPLEYLQKYQSLFDEIQQLNIKNKENDKSKYYGPTMLQALAKINSRRVTLDELESIYNKVKHYAENPSEFFEEHIDSINSANEELPF